MWPRYRTILRIAAVLLGLVIVRAESARHKKKRQLSQYTWGTWGPWSTCSRTCGRGVAHQTRRCLYAGVEDSTAVYPSGNDVGKYNCAGIFRRYKACAEQTCPPGTPDARAEQCTTYNSKPFMGRLYQWEPFLEAPQKCELNCRAKGYRFYARLSLSVTDGTPCSPGSPDVCIGGQCKRVGCDGVLGSQTALDKCGVCGGDNSACQVVSGMFTRHHLPVGYNPLMRIPAGARHINITELAHSKNYIALKNTKSKFYLNGKWEIDYPGTFKGAGTTFQYTRSTPHQRNRAGQTLLATGPTNEDLEVMLIYQQRNPGILYEYILPAMPSVTPSPPPLPVTMRPSIYITKHTSDINKAIRPHGTANRDSATSNRHEGTGDRDSSVSNRQHGTANRDSSSSNRHHHSTADRDRPPPNRYHSDNSNSEKVDGASERTGGGQGGTDGSSHGSSVVPRGSQEGVFGGSNNAYIPGTSHQSIYRPGGPSYRPTGGVYLGGGTAERGSEGTQYLPGSYRPGETLPNQNVYTGGIDRGGLNPSQDPSPRSPPGRTFPEGVYTGTNLGPVEGVFQGSTEEFGPGRREFEWTVSGYTQCSRTCGRGVRTNIIQCIRRDSGAVVLASNCDNRIRPPVQPVPCNTQPCPAFWDEGEWTPCSKTCGPGIKTRMVLCRQTITHSFTTTVSPRKCRSSPKPATSVMCQLGICSKWRIEAWGPCSVPCGRGQRTREVNCVTSTGEVRPDGECNLRIRPHLAEDCDMGQCANSWFYSDWGKCSTDCGNGIQKRNVLCILSQDHDLPLGSCDGKEKPSETQSCDMDSCNRNSAHWFSGPWGPCSAPCGEGTQERDVMCISVNKREQAHHIVSHHRCEQGSRPAHQQRCEVQPCTAMWYHTDWSQCSKTCDGGYRVRVVQCLDEKQQISTKCNKALRPSDREPCSVKPCYIATSHAPVFYRPSTPSARTVSGFSTSPVISEPAERLYSVARNSDDSCIDKFHNCNLVVQARMCHYGYYKKVCCASCFHNKGYS
ncbi:PREDICTED: thrombospondin type-1 domain-containing protein 4-like isoform X1 [Branchiostoma belcheri]|uniref:Thrombospondin type-1 domain-containing protein 4-like isoform X1 n=1 Tax=Branchiostoma belcheri TaxID=7741 RepID=A0A6P4YQ13_BRABE|nr:PREDICTED: thrombospondin type-1 domain-containing protein 4-like isoform X1 [Branchiostoma belcheri]XP_019623773.1 PREDICTED: thrombospondin type-1 domain-containing protein 4-like isoform X1 [Branchiostoma belcheri]XP_019623774.1 PREDICTED: thrombospondin type-1 domain-containing protein 4-like isoform X1 [Branchiostoma belcheri]XP_019623775.1 PREDICTED: thrombospondin type-1 domain-containing protein 4-like isoform X1 [Branchiostoma belcheri]XP_019623776.1 PREDICTED: thrombospondin type-1